MIKRVSQNTSKSTESSALNAQYCVLGTENSQRTTESNNDDDKDSK
jgi:hypothetical protein